MPARGGPVVSSRRWPPRPARAADPAPQAPPPGSPERSQHRHARAIDRPRRRRRRSTSCSPRPSRRPPACSTPTARWSTSSTPRPANLRFAHDAGHPAASAAATGSASLELAPGTGMFGRAVAERAVVVTEDYRNDPSFRHAEGDRTGSSPTSASARWSWRRSSPATRCSARSARSRRRTRRLRPGPDRARPLARRPCRRGHGQHPPHRGARPVARRARRAGRGRADACARSTPGSRPPPTSRACSSARSTRRPACCAPTAPASISSTRRSGPAPLGLRLGALKPDDDIVARRPRRDARPGHLRPGRRQRPDRSGPATTATTSGSRTARGADTLRRRRRASARSWPRRSSARPARSGR